MSDKNKFFEQRRKALLAAMLAHTRGPVVKKGIPFRNDDVPRYLRKLDEYERQSRDANLVVGLLKATVIGRRIA